LRKEKKATPQFSHYENNPSTQQSPVHEPTNLLRPVLSLTTSTLSLHPIIPEPDLGPRVSRTMPYADPYAAVHASVTSQSGTFSELQKLYWISGRIYVRFLSALFIDSSIQISAIIFSLMVDLHLAIVLGAAMMQSQVSFS